MGLCWVLGGFFFFFLNKAYSRTTVSTLQPAALRWPVPGVLTPDNGRLLTHKQLPFKTYWKWAEHGNSFSVRPRVQGGALATVFTLTAVEVCAPATCKRRVLMGLLPAHCLLTEKRPWVSLWSVGGRFPTLRSDSLALCGIESQTPEKG